MNPFTRTEIILGSNAMRKLESSCVAIFGIGGVGSYTAEALARCGVGEFVLCDNDKVCVSNINRQIIATRKTIGQQKVEVMKERILDINPNAKVHSFQCFYNADNAKIFDFSKYDYIVDAIDTVSSKLALIENANRAHTPIISCMGAGNKLDPTKFEVVDIYETSICPLAKVMRHELRARGIESLKVVYSKEPALKPIESANCETKVNGERQVTGSVSFVPSVAGLIIAGEVVKGLTNFEIG